MNLLKKRLIKSVSSFLAVLIFTLPLSAFAAENNGKINQTPPTISLDKGTQQNSIITNSANKNIKKDKNNKEIHYNGIKTWIAKASLQALAASLRYAAGVSRVTTLVKDNYGDDAEIIEIIRSNCVIMAEVIDGLCFEAEVYKEAFISKIAGALVEQEVASTTARTVAEIMVNVIDWGMF